MPRESSAFSRDVIDAPSRAQPAAGSRSGGRLMLFVEGGHARACALLMLIACICFLPKSRFCSRWTETSRVIRRRRSRCWRPAIFIDIRFQDEARHKKPVGHLLDAGCKRERREKCSACRRRAPMSRSTACPRPSARWVRYSPPTGPGSLSPEGVRPFFAAAYNGGQPDPDGRSAARQDRRHAAGLYASSPWVPLARAYLVGARPSCHGRMCCCSGGRSGSALLIKGPVILLFGRSRRRDPEHPRALPSTGLRALRPGIAILNRLRHRRALVSSPLAGGPVPISSLHRQGRTCWASLAPRRSTTGRRRGPISRCSSSPSGPPPILASDRRALRLGEPAGGCRGLPACLDRPGLDRLRTGADQNWPPLT